MDKFSFLVNFRTQYTQYTQGIVRVPIFFLAQPPRKKAGYFSTPRKCRYWKDWDPLNPNLCSGPGFKLILKSNIAKVAFPMQFVRGKIWEFWPGDRSPAYGYTWWGHMIELYHVTHSYMDDSVFEDIWLIFPVEEDGRESQDNLLT